MHAKQFDLGRFSDPSLLILASLASGPKHGYAMMEDIAEFSGTKLEPGTLYAALARLERRDKTQSANQRLGRKDSASRTFVFDNIFF
jgi:DNA-binding PadR family transcriptional regulator